MTALSRALAYAREHAPSLVPTIEAWVTRVAAGDDPATIARLAAEYAAADAATAAEFRARAKVWRKAARALREADPTRETVGWLVKDREDSRRPYFGADELWNERAEVEPFTDRHDASLARHRLLGADQGDAEQLVIVRITRPAKSRATEAA